MSKTNWRPLNDIFMIRCSSLAHLRPPTPLPINGLSVASAGEDEHIQVTWLRYGKNGSWPTHIVANVIVLLKFITSAIPGRMCDHT